MTDIDNMLSVVGFIVLWIVAVFLLVVFVEHIIIVRGLDTHVWWSQSRDECVRVDPPDRGTCDDLPARFIKVPVQ